MQTIRLIPSAYTLSSTQYLTITDAQNMYANTDSETYAQVNHNRNNTTAYYLYIHGFNFNSVPSNAVVNSFTVKLKALEYALSTGSTYYCSLYNNTTSLSNTTLSSALGTSVQTFTFPNGSLSWSVLRGYGNNFRIRVPLRRSNSNTSGYVRIYGAEILVEYTILKTVTAISNADGVTVSPQTQTVDEGSDAVITIDCDDISDYIVKDNGFDVTSLVVMEHTPSAGTVTATADSFTTGFDGGTSMNFYMSSNATGHNFNYAVGHTAESPGSTSTGSGSWTYVKSNGGSTTNTGYADFAFDFSDIPSSATVTSVQVMCYGAVEDRSQNTSHADISLFSGNVQKGATQSFTSSTNSVITLSNVGTWTRDELQSAKLRFSVGYYGGHIFGITWTVSYTVPTTSYYTYTIRGVSDDHTVTVSEDIVVPPDEDQGKTYFPVTISSINALTDPTKGTTRFESGSTLTAEIYPTKSQLTLVTDNGTVIADTDGIYSPNLIHNGIAPTYTVSGVTSNYNFVLSASTGWYTSTNKGVASSAAVSRVTFNLPVRSIVTFRFINYAQQGQDYGVFGNIDTALGTTTATTSDNAKLICSNATYNTPDVQTLNYEMEAGTHFVDVKYRKNASTNSYNDTLQFKVEISELEVNEYYTYKVQSVDQNRSLVFIFGDVEYYFVTSSGDNVKLFPDGQMVQLVGDEYKLTIVPNNISDTVSVRDNNTDVTSSVERKEYVIDGEDVVNYVYKIPNITTGHNITVSTQSNTIIHLKVNGSWVTVSRVHQKLDGRWQTADDVARLFDNGTIYIKK